MAKKNKTTKLSAADILELAPGFGTCVASDAVTVDGARIGFMYRETPDTDDDSGWRFMSGAESEEYLDDPDHSALYDVNTIANCDRDIIPLLSSPVGAAFERVETGAPLTPTDLPTEAELDAVEGLWPPAGFRLVEGDYVLNDAWKITLPAPFARRVEDGSLVLWRPGVTIWIDAFANGEQRSQAERCAERKSDFPAEARVLRDDVDGAVTRLSVRFTDESDQGPVEALIASVWADEDQLDLTIYFDETAGEDLAQSLADGVTLR